jgi:hypothetical protein
MRPADHVRATAAALLLLVFLSASWTALYEQSVGGHIALLALLASLPAVARLVPRLHRGMGVVAAAAAGLIGLLGVMTLAGRVSFWQLVTLDGDTWTRVLRIIPDGALEASDTSLPLDVADVPALAGVLDLAFAGLAACLAWQLAVRRRPLVSIAALGLGLGYRWTVVAPERPALQGALALAAALAVLGLLLRSPPPAGAWRGSALGRTVVLGAGLVALSAGAGAGWAQGGEGWWDWRSWDVTSGQGGSFNLNLEQEYGQLSWPGQPVPLFRVESDRQTPLRAVVLERFDGTRFVEQSGLTRALPRDGERYETGEFVPPGADEIYQRVTLLAGDSPLLLAGGRPVWVLGPFAGTVEKAGQSIRVDPPVRRGQTYGVNVWIPDPSPADLVRVRDYRFGDVQPHLLSVPSGFSAEVNVPLWGTGTLPASAFGDYAEVYRLSREWIGDATSAYQAVNRVESRLRGRFTYDERPPTPPAGVSPIADFLLTTKRGFCQQFAASMALMLRMNGIPARVAVGFASGRYDAARDSYEVVDRDAHSWVEVWFPEQGWLPFDPTPASGRFAPNRASVSNPDYRSPSVDLQLESEPVKPPDADPPVRRPPVDVGSTQPPQAPERAVGGWGWPEFVALSIMGLLLLAATPTAAKLVRRARRRRGGDDRDRVLGALQEFESTLADLGMAPDPALTASERGEALRASSGLDASELYRRAAEARFARLKPPPDAATWCWRESRRLRRNARRAVAARARWAAPFRVRSLRRATLSEE